MKLNKQGQKPKTIYYDPAIEKQLRQIALNNDMNLAQYLSYVVTQVAAGRVKILCVALALTASLLTSSCSGRLCDAYNSLPHKHRRG